MEDYGFKFKLGQFVRHVGVVEAQHQMLTAIDTLMEGLLQKEERRNTIIKHNCGSMLIVNRVLENCHGGYQRFYDVRILGDIGPVLCGTSSPMGLVRFAEPELMEAE